MEEGHGVWWVQIYPVPEWWAHQGKKRGGWSDAPIMPSVCCTSLWGQGYDLGLLQLVWSRFSNMMYPKNEVSWLPEYTEWPGVSINGFVLSWWYRHIPSSFHHFHTWIGHHGVLTLTPNLWDVLEKALRSGPTLPSSIQDLNATLDGNKSCDTAESYRMPSLHSECVA